MKARVFFLCISLMMSTSLTYASLASDQFVDPAFRKEIFEKWSNAIGVVDIPVTLGYGKSEVLRDKIEFRTSPEDNSPIIQTVAVPPPINVEVEVRPGVKGLSDKLWKEKQGHIKNYPFFVSAFGEEELPGGLITLPILEKRGEWVRVFIDWDCQKKGWFKLTNNEVPFIFNSSIQSSSVITPIFYAIIFKPTSIFVNPQDIKAAGTLSPESVPEPFLGGPRLIICKPNGKNVYELFRDCNGSKNKHCFLKESPTFSVFQWISHDSGD